MGKDGADGNRNMSRRPTVVISHFLLLPSLCLNYPVLSYRWPSYHTWNNIAGLLTICGMLSLAFLPCMGYYRWPSYHVWDILAGLLTMYGIFSLAFLPYMEYCQWPSYHVWDNIAGLPLPIFWSYIRCILYLSSGQVVSSNSSSLPLLSSCSSSLVIVVVHIAYLLVVVVV